MSAIIHLFSVHCFSFTHFLCSNQNLAFILKYLAPSVTYTSFLRLAGKKIPVMSRQWPS